MIRKAKPNNYHLYLSAFIRVHLRLIFILKLSQIPK